MNLLFVSLGCDKNRVDAERMLGLLSERGYQLVDDEAQADVIVINTCCFIQDAMEESIQTILEMAEYKKTGRLQALIVTGCLAQRYQEEIFTEIPEVDAVLGTTAFDQIVDAIDAALAGQQDLRLADVDAQPKVDAPRVITTGGHYAYLKIAEGCDKGCTYCVIPSLRGAYRSVPMEQLLAEAGQLAEEGVKELILVAQETTLYGKDLYGEKRLPDLLRALCEIDGIRWIRLLYCYPEEIDEDLIQVMKKEEKVCHYLDLPIQHASDDILRRMGRKTTRAALVQLIDHLRSEIPDLTLRTTLITGFPGETEADHETLLAFVEEMAFDRLGVFTYSQEEGTPAAAMPDQIPEDVKETRRDQLMERQQDVALANGQALIGQTLSVLIEGKLVDEDAYVGRTYRDAPDVDGLIFVDTTEELATGDFVRCRVTDALEYDLIGEIVS